MPLCRIWRTLKRISQRSVEIQHLVRAIDLVLSKGTPVNQEVSQVISIATEPNQTRIIPPSYLTPNPLRIMKQTIRILNHGAVDEKGDVIIGLGEMLFPDPDIMDLYPIYGVRLLQQSQQSRYLSVVSTIRISWWKSDIHPDE